MSRSEAIRGAKHALRGPKKRPFFVRTPPSPNFVYAEPQRQN
jgi:hypothetical protein